MAKKDWKTVSKGKKRIVVERKSDGKRKTLLTATGKCAKFKRELENNVHITNDGKYKRTNSGEPKKLTRGQKAYRKGFIMALGEQASIYKKQQG